MALLAKLIGWFRTPRLPPEFESLRDELYDDDDSVRVLAVEAIRNSGKPRLSDYLLARIQHGDADLLTTTAIRNALVDLGTISTKPLVKALRHKNPLIRAEAASCLGGIKNITTVMPLVAALKDSDENVRWKSANALSFILDKCALEPFVDLLQHPVAKRPTVFLLSKLGNFRAVAPLIAAFKASKDDDHKGEILTALSAIGGDPAHKFLLAIAQSSNFKVSRMAESLLANINVQSALDKISHAKFASHSQKNASIHYLLSLNSDIEKTLSQHGCNISEHVLYEAASLKDFAIVCEYERWIEMGSEPWDHPETNKQTHEVGFSRVRQLARDELVRRGKAPDKEKDPDYVKRVEANEAIRAAERKVQQIIRGQFLKGRC